MSVSNRSVVEFLVKKATDFSLGVNDVNTKKVFGLTDNDIEILNSKNSLNLRAYLTKQKDHTIKADWDHVANIHSVGCN